MQLFLQQEVGLINPGEVYCGKMFVKLETSLTKVVMLCVK